MFEINYRPRIFQATEMTWEMRMALPGPVSLKALAAYNALKDLEDEFREYWEARMGKPCPWMEGS